MIKLFFPLTQARQLAEHAAAASRHFPSWTQAEGGLAGKPSLVWVKEDAIFLMSNGKPALLRDPLNSRPDFVAYAQGWGPGSHQELSRINGIGDDDFEEHIDLSTPLGPFPTVLQALRATSWAGFGALVITARDDLSYSLSIQRADPQ